MQDSPGQLVTGNEVACIIDHLYRGTDDYLTTDLVRPLSGFA